MKKIISLCTILIFVYCINVVHAQLYVIQPGAVVKKYLGISIEVDDATGHPDIDVRYKTLQVGKDDIFLKKDSVDGFLILESLVIDSVITSRNNPQRYMFTVAANEFAPLEGLSADRQKEMYVDIAAKMTMLQTYYQKVYNRPQRFPEEDEFTPYMNDVLYYNDVYKMAENALGELCLNDKPFFEQNLRINLLGDYAYNGDSGEGYFTFAKLLATRPEWVVAIYKDSKDQQFKDALVARLHNRSQWVYALSYWPELFISRNPELHTVMARPYNREFAGKVAGIYEPFIRKIDKKWDKRILEQ